MVSFKFKVGDILCHRANTELFVGAPPAMFVVERQQQECPGGTQRHYWCRVVSYSGITTALISFNEVELEEYPRERVKRSRPQGADESTESPA